MLNPTQLGEVKENIICELNKNLFKWNDLLKGTPLSYSDVKVLNGGKGQIVDDCPFVRYAVKFNVVITQQPLKS